MHFEFGILQLHSSLKMLAFFGSSGIIDDEGRILSNVRDTFITPPGTGFLPRETAEHHRKFILALVEQALQEAKVSPRALACLAYTKGFCCLLVVFQSCVMFRVCLESN